MILSTVNSRYPEVHIILAVLLLYTYLLLLQLLPQTAVTIQYLKTEFVDDKLNNLNKQQKNAPIVF